MKTITSTGIVIGGHYIQKPPQPSRDAELLQKALLARRGFSFPDTLAVVVCIVAILSMAATLML